eukprot:6150878-Pleurochrysis_carterae.AAC.3
MGSGKGCACELRSDTRERCRKKLVGNLATTTATVGERGWGTRRVTKQLFRGTSNRSARSAPSRTARRRSAHTVPRSRMRRSSPAVATKEKRRKFGGAHSSEQKTDRAHAEDGKGSEKETTTRKVDRA